MNDRFANKIKAVDPDCLAFDDLRTLQVNLGNRCNQKCSHCHVKAHPNGSKIMTRSVMGKIIEFLKSHPNLTVDITGGCPELNPDFGFFIESVHPLAAEITIRTNLTVLLEPGLGWVAPWYADHKVALIASLPCYTADNVDHQRGRGVFQQSIDALRLLNKLGYATAPDLTIDLVYNPAADNLPPDQSRLESDYKSHLLDEYGIRFNRLYALANAPIGRFRDLLETNGRLNDYIQLLIDSFNPVAVDAVMCRSLVSVDYRGLLYNCDFNQALDLPIIDTDGRPATIDHLEKIIAGDLTIVTDDHCFCCTAGAGSSCTGALTKQA